MKPPMSATTEPAVLTMDAAGPTRAARLVGKLPTHAEAMTDAELAAWVPKNFVPDDGVLGPAREAGIASRVMAVIRTIRKQYETDAWGV